MRALYPTLSPVAWLAGCTCDTSDQTQVDTYQLATAFAYVGMALGGLMSYLLPTYDVRVHVAIGAVQAVAYLFQARRV